MQLINKITKKANIKEGYLTHLEIVSMIFLISKISGFCISQCYIKNSFKKAIYDEILEKRTDNRLI